MHAYQVETIISMDTVVSQNESNFIFCYKGHFLFLLIQKKLAEETIFVGNRLNKNGALKTIFVKKIQYCN